MVEAINRALGQALEDDERILVMGQDVGKLGGVFRATDGLQARYGNQRVFDTPLAESAIVGTAFGMSLTGLRPVAEIQFMGFMYKCLDQLVAQAGQIREQVEAYSLKDVRRLIMHSHLHGNGIDKVLVFIDERRPRLLVVLETLRDESLVRPRRRAFAR